MLLAFDGRNRGYWFTYRKAQQQSLQREKAKPYWLFMISQKPWSVCTKYSDPMSVEQAQFALEKLARADGESSGFSRQSDQKTCVDISAESAN